VTYLLTRLVQLGVFPPTPPTSRSQPSFFHITLPVIRTRFQAGDHKVYSAYWWDVFRSLPSTFTLQAILVSLFSSLSELPSGLDSSPPQRVLVKREATLLKQLVGPLNAQNDELWECASALFLSRDWNEGQARIFACWVAGCDKDNVDHEGAMVPFSLRLHMHNLPDPFLRKPSIFYLPKSLTCGRLQSTLSTHCLVDTVVRFPPLLLSPVDSIRSLNRPYLTTFGYCVVLSAPFSTTQ
jgi:hypothetical protein